MVLPAPSKVPAKYFVVESLPTMVVTEILFVSLKNFPENVSPWATI